MDIELGPYDELLIVVSAYDEGLRAINVIARSLNRRSWFYFTFTKPVLTDFGDLLIYNSVTNNVYSYRNSHLKYHLQKTDLSENILKELYSNNYYKLDEEYEKYLPDGYLQGGQNG
ncbi:MAG: hypothetical protein PVI43_00845 [Candidatus Bathyarchaeota archaeon]|jgi:hypothetical protein